MNRIQLEHTTFHSRTGIQHGIGHLGRVSSTGRDEGFHWNLLNGKMPVDMLSYILVITFFSHISPTLATAAMKRTSRKRTQNIRMAFHHSTRPYRNSSRPKGCAIADAENPLAYFDDHSQFSFVNANQIIYLHSIVLIEFILQ
jgi:hypothetical protein